MYMFQVIAEMENYFLFENVKVRLCSSITENSIVENDKTTICF